MKRRSKKKVVLVSEQLRRIVEECGLSRYRICLETGIPASTMSRFMSGQRPLPANALDALGKLLGLEVVKRGGKRS